MAGPLFAVKDGAEILSYTLDWSTEMGTDTVASAAWTVPAGLAQVATSTTTTTTTIRVSGGTLGTLYQLVCHAIGASGQEYERTIWLKIENK